MSNDTGCDYDYMQDSSNDGDFLSPSRNVVQQDKEWLDEQTGHKTGLVLLT